MLAACGGDDGPGPATEAPPPAGAEPPPAAPGGNDDDPNDGGPNGGPNADDPNDGTRGNDDQRDDPNDPNDDGSTANAAPTISGEPPTTALVDSPYVFEPAADDADGDPLTFSVSRMPEWATFSPNEGRIEGTPGPGDVGTYSEIVVSVSDGQSDASLGAFEISVEAIASGTVTLEWMPPQLNADGTPLTDLAGFHLYWGTEPGDYSNTVTIDGPGVTTHVLDNLLPDTYYFAATAFNTEGMESDMSNETRKTVM